MGEGNGHGKTLTHKYIKPSEVDKNDKCTGERNGHVKTTDSPGNQR